MMRQELQGKRRLQVLDVLPVHGPALREPSAGVFVAQEENEETTGKMVYIGSVYVMDDSINQVTSGGNADFVMNSLEYMLDRDETISIRAKSLDTEYLTIDSGTAFKWQVILIGIIPLALIIWGGAVCYQRRKM